MPKKTREEKILARLRRLEKTQAESEATPAPTAGKSNFSLNDVEKNKPSTSTTTHSSNRAALDYSYVKKDLRKIAVLTVAALLVEFVLSLTASSWYAKLFPRLF
jgi:hypothetical protein